MSWDEVVLNEEDFEIYIDYLSGITEYELDIVESMPLAIIVQSVKSTH